MRRASVLLAVVFVCGMASSAMGGAAVQIQMTDAQCNYDGYISQDEANHGRLYDPRGEWGLSRRSVGGHVFGEHFADRCMVWDSQFADPEDGVGIPADGVITTSYGSFQLSTTLDSGAVPTEPLMTTDDAPYTNTNYPDQIWDNPKGKLAMPDNILRVWRNRDGLPSHASAIQTFMLDVTEQGQYSDLNMLVQGSNEQVSVHAEYDDGAGGLERVLLYASFFQDANNEVGWPAWNNTTSSNPDMELAFTTTHHWGMSGDSSAIRTDDGHLWTFKQPLLLDSTKTLKGITVEVYDVGAWDGRDAYVFAMTAYSVGTMEGVDAGTSTVSAAPELIPNDGATTSTITVVCQDADHDRVTDLEESDFLVVITGDGTNPVTWVGETANPGVYEFTMTSTTPGSKTVNVTADTVAIDDTATIDVYDVNKPTQGTVDASPDAIPDDGQYPSVLTIELANAGGTPASGYVSTISIVQTDGTGTATVGTVTETATPGTYEVEVTGTGMGDVELTVYVYEGTGDEATIGTDTITVFTPGVNDYPLADAGADQSVEDTDGDSKEEITLDASGSYDATGITNYLWMDGTEQVYSGTEAVVMIDFQMGVHDLVLTVSDIAGNYHSDFATISVLPPADDESVQLDISGTESGSGYNYDGYYSEDERAHCYEYDPRGQWGLSRRYVNSILGEHFVGGTIPILEGQTAYAVGIPASGFIHTSYGTYELSTDNVDSGDYPKAALMTTDDAPYTNTDYPDQIWDNPLGRLPLADNIVRATHVRGRTAPDPSAIVSVILPAGQQAAYDSINFIMAGNNQKATIYANYAGEGAGTDGTLIWEAPVIAEVQTGIPSLHATPANPAIVSALFIDNHYYGASGDVTSIRTGTDQNLWTFAAPLALNPAKTLVGFTVYADDSDQWTGTEAAIYAASAMAASGAPLEVTAALAAGEDWVYQNTETTTDDRHTSLATISLVTEASPGEVYNVSVADDGPGGANFTLGAVVDNRPGEQTLTVPIIGGRVGVGTPGTAGAAYTVTLTVEGQTSTQSDTADVTLALRYIGDVDGSGAPGAQDKQFFNQRLNNVATAYPDRCYDLNGSGGAPNAEDKQVMNQVLNGVALP